MGIITKKSGLYNNASLQNTICTLEVLDNVVLKPRSFLNGFKTDPIGVEVDGVHITSEMEKAMGTTLEVVVIDLRDNTFWAEYNGRWFWWPFSIIDRII